MGFGRAGFFSGEISSRSYVEPPGKVTSSVILVQRRDRRIAARRDCLWPKHAYLEITATPGIEQPGRGKILGNTGVRSSGR
jgi:hypothetical protein